MNVKAAPVRERTGLGKLSCGAHLVLEVSYGPDWRRGFRRQGGLC